MLDTETKKLFKSAFEERIAFNKLVGIQLISFDPLVLGLKNRPELLGNVWQGFLHGGVIATMLDVAGGISVALAFIKQNPHASFEEIGSKITKISTIDLRIDYLRPGVGEQFTATTETMRHGNRITVVRMTFHNEEEILVAAGTGTYALG